MGNSIEIKKSGVIHTTEKREEVGKLSLTGVIGGDVQGGHGWKHSGVKKGQMSGSKKKGREYPQRRNAKKGGVVHARRDLIHH